jgi:hypothetical protein
LVVHSVLGGPPIHAEVTVLSTSTHRSCCDAKILLFRTNLSIIPTVGNPLFQINRMPAATHDWKSEADQVDLSMWEMNVARI